jgi:hypothetical protein
VSGPRHHHTGTLPDEHTNQFGPQLTALFAYLTVVRMPRLVVQRFLEGAL